MHDVNLLEDQPIAWTPTPDVIERAQLTKFMKQVGVSTWDELYEFSIRDVEKFTEEVLKFLDIKFDPPFEKLLDTSEGIEFPEWFVSPPRRRDAEEQKAETRTVGTVHSTTGEDGLPQSREDAKEDREGAEVEDRPEPGAIATGSHAGLNITTMCLDRWQTDEMKDQPAVIWEGENGAHWHWTYEDLFEQVEFCASGLRHSGITKGDAVGIFLPMTQDIATVLMAIARVGAVAVPVFSGYGVEAIVTRMNAVGAKALFVCTGFERRGKRVDTYAIAIEAIEKLRSIKRVFVRDTLGTSPEFPDERYIDWHELLDLEFGRPEGEWKDLHHAEPTSAEDPLIILYTSGTTGKPKGIAHTHASFPIKAAQDMAFGTDVGRGTRICWYTDIGWMMGPWLIYGALINGATICLYDGAPDYPTHDRMWEFCAKHKVEVLGISPTLVRALAAHEETNASGTEQVETRPVGRVSAAGKEDVFTQSREDAKDESDSDLTTTRPRRASAPLLDKEGSQEDLGSGIADRGFDENKIRNPRSAITDRHDLSSLRAFASTGEPWNPAPWWWLFEKVGNSRLPIINYSGGTEIAGGILMGNPLLPIKPCSFPAPCPGMDVDILDEDGKSVESGKVGELVIKQPWIGMARGFWQERERYLDTYWRRFPNIWVHGDWAMRDKDGHWFILGRSDDTLKVAGKRVGPAEVESLLVAHPLVTEAAVIGVPDEAKGTAMVAFCVLSDPAPQRREDTKTEQAEDLKADLKSLVARDMGKPLAPSRIHFVSALPKTRNAKVMRRVIRAAYLGEDAGDLSALENPQAVDELRSLSASAV